MRPTHSHRRRGFSLPLVLIAVALTTTLGGALVTASFHAVRNTRMAWQGESALHAADLALASASESLAPASVSAQAIGTRTTNAYTTADGITIRLTTVRTSPSTVLLDAVAMVNSGPTTIARRELSRIIHLDASAIPLRAALSILGELSLAQQPSIFARADSTGRESSCGIDTDTASNSALLTIPPFAVDSTSYDGAPNLRRISTDTAAAIRNAIWQRIAASNPTTELTSTPVTIHPTASGSTCTSNSGEPRRDASAIAACVTQWPLRRLSGSTGRVTLASSRHQGALVVHGDLELTGHLELRGLLLVEGTLDTRNGSLDATGAVIATHHNGGTSHLDASTTIRYSRCAALRAVTPLATSAPPPVLAWVQRY